MIIKRSMVFDVEPTAAEIAEVFAGMADGGQVVFFNELARIVSEWDEPFCHQMQAIIDHPALTSEARQLMAEIGVYAS